MIERIFEEGQGWDSLYLQMKEALKETLVRYAAMSGQALVDHRYEKFRKIGRTGDAGHDCDRNG